MTDMQILHREGADSRYCHMTHGYPNILLLEIGMKEKYGEVIMTSDGEFRGKECVSDPSLYYAHQGDDIQRRFDFPAMRGWTITMTKYTAYTMLVLFTKEG